LTEEARERKWRMYTIFDDVTRHIRSLYFCLIKESVAHYVECLCLICL
jgi:hypothetical protein